MTKRYLVFAAMLGLSSMMAWSAPAQEWEPSGPLKIRIGFAPGGSADAVGRIMAEALERSTGWTTIVENRGGGGGAVMAAGLAREKPDGLTLGFGISNALATELASDNDTPFTLDSFDYLGTVAVGPGSFLARADAPFSNMNELVDFARENNGALFGVTTKTDELIVRAIGKQAGVDLTPVPTQGGSEVIVQILGGHIDAGFDGARHVEYVHTGQLKVLASVIGNRHEYAPESPTLIEQGFDYVNESYYIFMAPTGLSEEARTAIVDAIDVAASSEAVVKAIDDMFQIPIRNLGLEGSRAMMEEAVEQMIQLSAPAN